MIDHTLDFQPTETIGRLVNVILASGTELTGRPANSLDWAIKSPRPSEIVQYEVVNVEGKPVMDDNQLLDLISELVNSMTASPIPASAPGYYGVSISSSLMARLKAAVSDYDTETLWSMPDGTPVNRKLDRELKEWLAKRG